MKRRDLFTSAAIATSAIALNNLSAKADSLPEIRWRMTTSWPESLDILYGGAQRICDLVSAMTNGRFQITPYAAGEITSSFGVLDAVKDNKVDCGHTASYYYLDQNPALAFGTTIPFGMNAEQQNSWLYSGGGQDLINEIYQDFGILSFPAGNTGVQMGGWFKRKINSVADLQGLVMKIPGLGGQVMSRLGVDVQLLSADQIAQAVLEEEINAMEWSNPYDDEIIGLPEVAIYYYYPGWWEPGATYELQVNQQQWQKLPSEYQEILKVATTNANSLMLAEYNAKNGRVLQRLRDRGVELVPFSSEIMQAAIATTIETLEEYSSQNETFRKVYQQWRSFRSRVYRWNRVNELSFTNFTSKTI